jgi:hypothetical protein
VPVVGQRSPSAAAPVPPDVIDLVAASAGVSEEPRLAGATVEVRGDAFEWGPDTPWDAPRPQA